MTKSTTSLVEVVEGESFTWGEIISIEEIGPYTVAAYNPRKAEGVTLTHEIDYSIVEYYGWIDGKSLGQSWHSLDAALAGCMAYRHEGPNHHAGHYFMKMLEGGE